MQQADTAVTGLPGAIARLGARGGTSAFAALLALALSRIQRPPMNGSPIYMLLAAALLAGGIVISRVLPGRGWALPLLSSAGIAIGCWLSIEASFPGAMLPVAFLLGLGAGPLLRPPAEPNAIPARSIAGVPASGIVALATAAAVVVAVALRQTAVAAFLAGAAAVPALLARGIAHSGPSTPGLRLTAAASLYGVVALFTAAWVGSTSPRIHWFGALTDHGPRSRAEVALTFDDGPNGEYTLTIAAILEEHGVRGTFFLVGKAVEQQAAVSRRLLQRGHVLGNHSFHHDAWRYLDPAYPELDRTQRSFSATLGVCPALFRPPHGTHTPFMSRVVESEGLTLVTWDVSARDWVEDDPAALARHVLDRVKHGSIILLHDGIDGIPGADRSVVVKALPAILDGLKEKGLQPVTLDRLLGKPAYLPPDSC